MNEDLKTSMVLSGLGILFLVIAAAFRLNLWGHVQPVVEWPSVDPAFTNTASVRLSIVQALAEGADPSDYDCYVCHERGKPPELKFDADNRIVLPDEHSDLVMRHGRRNRNDNCYNCHEPDNLDKVKTRGGEIVSMTNSVVLCASCHGPTQRDWEQGVHGRTSGYWDRTKGEFSRLVCTSCHDPHSPKFQSLEPAPAPRLLHPAHGLHAETDHGAEAAAEESPEEGTAEEPADATKADETKDEEGPP